MAAECVFPRRSGEPQEDTVSVCNETPLVPLKQGHWWLIPP